MSELLEPEETSGTPGHHTRISGPQNIRSQADFFDARAEADADAAAEARDHHDGLSARLVASADGVHDLIERMRHDGPPVRGELSPLATALARHIDATETTARRALEERHAAVDVVRRDREEGEQLQRMLAELIAHEPPSGTYALTVGGLLADIDQYVAHERRDLVPLIERELPLGESERLSRAFPT